jgi:ferredoxin-NADP reductase
MTAYDVRLEAREGVAERTMAFHFEKPPAFHFKAGQAIDVVLHDLEVPAPSDAPRHTFSLVSAPYQRDLVVATRLRESAYKLALKDLSIGSVVRVEGPFGSLTLHNNRARPAVFVAGGIGITPFMSILRQAEHDRLPQTLALVYSNRRPEDAAFLAELRQLERSNARFRLFATMTRMSQSGSSWDGAVGYVDEALLKRATADLEPPIYYVAGPPSMVEATRRMLNQTGIDDDDIRSEEFYGY